METCRVLRQGVEVRMTKLQAELLVVLGNGAEKQLRLQDYILDETQDEAKRLWVWQHYGTSYRSIYTMPPGCEREGRLSDTCQLLLCLTVRYELTFAGNWGVYARPVLEDVSHGYVIFFVVHLGNLQWCEPSTDAFPWSTLMPSRYITFIVFAATWLAGVGQLGKDVVRWRIEFYGSSKWVCRRPIRGHPRDHSDFSPRDARGC